MFGNDTGLRSQPAELGTVVVFSLANAEESVEGGYHSVTARATLLLAEK
jgi:hypothetical protein